MSTVDNLKEAFAGESQASRKYLAFAKQAEKEGFSQIAKLFRAGADAETVHALAHLEVMDIVSSTEDNLKAAIEGETSEFEQMYPKFIEQAKDEENNKAKISFYRANAVEEVHADLYKKALEEIGNNKEVDYYVCQACGHTVEDQAPDICPICGQPKNQFKLIS